MIVVLEVRSKVKVAVLELNEVLRRLPVDLVDQLDKVCGWWLIVEANVRKKGTRQVDLWRRQLRKILA